MCFKFFSIYLFHCFFHLLAKQQVDETCTTLGCIRTSMKILESMDSSVDPCDNFYDFACGKYLNNTFIEHDKYLVNSFTDISNTIQTQLQVIINEDIKTNESKPFRMAKQLYNSCMNITKIEQIGLKPLKELLDKFGGWPVAKGDQWSETDWDFIEMIKKLRNHGLPTSGVIDTSIGAHFDNSTRRTLRVSSTG